MELQNKKPLTSCKIDGCLGKGDKKKNGTIVFKKGYCIKHYTRLLKHGDVSKGDTEFPKEKYFKCKIEGCNGLGSRKKNGTIVYSKGYCVKHYSRLKINGDPLIVKLIIGEERKNNPLYSVHTNMKDRCYNKNQKQYKNYGERGITVCNQWMGSNGFPQFLKDMGDRPNGYSLERIKVNGNYEPSNCKWANAHEQQANRRISNDVVGVYWSKSKNKWIAHLKINKKQINLGHYFNLQDAVKARKDAEIKYNIYPPDINKKIA